MNTLEKKLVSIANESVKESNSIVQEAKQLLESNVAEEKNLLRSIGLDQELSLVEDRNADVLTRLKHSEHFEKTVLHFDDIKKLCLDYRLYIRPARVYNGTIPAELSAELLRFCKEKNIPIPNHSSYSKFFIIAPPKMFKSYMSPVEMVANAFNVADAKRKERIRKRQEDPILVYQLDKDYFVVIKSWGEDFTLLRRIYGVLTKKTSVKILNFLAVVGVVFGMFKIGWWSFVSLYIYGKMAEKAGNHGLEIVSFLGMLGVAIGGIILIAIWIFSEYFNDLREDIRERVTASEERLNRDKFDV